MAKVSIIIPTYNVEPYLVECMESVVNQTLKDIEIICINDGSTDGSLAILKKYAEADDRIILVDKENGGYGIAMNIGQEKATGEYIGIVEPDDYVPLNMYEDLYNKAKEYDLDFVKADFYRFKTADNGNMELVYNHLSKKTEDYNVVFNPSEEPERLRYIMNTWSGIYKRSFLEKHNIRYNETPGASFQDNGFWFQTFLFGKRAMILDKPYYRNRRDNPGSSVANPQKVYCINVEYDHIREILVQYPEKWELFKAMYWLKRWHNSEGTLKRIANEYKWEYVQRTSQEFKRAMEKHELSEEVYTPHGWNRIKLIIKDPRAYFETFVVPDEDEKALRKLVRRLAEQVAKLEKANKSLKKQIEEVRTSWSFRIGKIITFIPGKIKTALKR